MVAPVTGRFQGHGPGMCLASTARGLICGHIDNPAELMKTRILEERSNYHDCVTSVRETLLDLARVHTG
jgi:hypothetical protein